MTKKESSCYATVITRSITKHANKFIQRVNEKETVIIMASTGVQFK